MAKEVKTGELVKQDTQALSVELARPAFLDQEEAVGTDHLTRDDIQMPRLSLAQLTSKELDPGDPAKYIDGLTLGNFFNNLSQQVYGDGPMEFCVVRADRPRYVEFVPLEAGGGVRDPNVPANDPRTQFGPMGEKPIATKFYDYVILLLPSREPISLSFKSTALKTAKQLNAFISMGRAPIFAGKYALTSMMTKNAKGRFAIPMVKMSGWIAQNPQDELWQYAKGVYEALAGKQITFDTEPVHDDFDVEALEREAAAQRSGPNDGVEPA